MIKKTITYKDYNEKEQTEDFYFNLSKGELVLLEMSAVDQNTEGLEDKIKKIEKTRSGREAAAVFKEIIGLAYGVKSHDGARFIKNPELLAEFESTGAYSDLVFELVLNSEVGSAFINGLMPSGLRESVQAELAKTGQVATDTSALSASEAARKASEARLQGHRPAQEKPKSSVERQPELPTVLETAAPVLEAEPQPSEPSVAEPDLSKLSREEIIAYYQTKK